MGSFAVRVLVLGCIVPVGGNGIAPDVHSAMLPSLFRRGAGGEVSAVVGCAVPDSPKLSGRFGGQFAAEQERWVEPKHRRGLCPMILGQGQRNCRRRAPGNRSCGASGVRTDCADKVSVRADLRRWILLEP